MTDHDPTKGAGDNGEFSHDPHLVLTRALGNVAYLRGQLDELVDKANIATQEADRLEQEKNRVRGDASNFTREAHDVRGQHRHATLDTLQSLSGVLDAEEMNVEDALQLVKDTLASLDGEVLADADYKNPWERYEYAGREKTPAIRPIDYDGLLDLANHVSELPEDEFVGIWQGRQLFLGSPTGDPRLRLSENQNARQETQPFPFTVEVEVAIARDDPDDEPKSFRGNLLVGADAIVVAALTHIDRQYVDHEGVPYPPRKVIDDYRRDQELIKDIREDRLYEKVSEEQKKNLEKAAKLSDTGFRTAIRQRASDVLHGDVNRRAYTSVLSEVYFDPQDYRKITTLIDSLYGDGISEARVKLAAYTQVLARLFEENGKLPDDVEVSRLDMAQAMYYLMLDKTGE